MLLTFTNKVTLSLTLVCTLSTQNTFAQTLVDIIQTPQCFSAQYNAEHLKTHPKQKVRALWIYVPPAKMNNYGDERKLMSGMDEKEGMGQIMARFKNDSANYISDGAECTVKPSGIWHCGIECDGGQFTLQTSPAGNVLLKPLYDRIRLTSCGEAPKERYINTDEDQAIFALHPVALAACKKLQRQYK
ncbi:MAG: hypothetical protein ACRCV6_08690 [Formosimonas sp.]